MIEEERRYVFIGIVVVIVIAVIVGLIVCYKHKQTPIQQAIEEQSESLEVETSIEQIVVESTQQEPSVQTTKVQKQNLKANKAKTRLSASEKSEIEKAIDSLMQVTENN